MVEPARKLFLRIKVLWAESHAGGDLILWLLVHPGWTMKMVRRSERSKGDCTDRKADQPASSGFRPLPRRWVVERSIACITRCRRLTRDQEGLPQRAEAFITLSASRRHAFPACPTFFSRDANLTLSNIVEGDPLWVLSQDLSMSW
jgi:transposase